METDWNRKEKNRTDRPLFTCNRLEPIRTDSRYTPGTSLVVSDPKLDVLQNGMSSFGSVPERSRENSSSIFGRDPLGSVLNWSRVNI